MFAFFQSDSLKIALRDSFEIAQRQAADSAAVTDSVANEPAVAEDTANALREAYLRAKESDTVEAVSGAFEGVLGGLQNFTGFSKDVLISLMWSALAVAVIWAIRLLVLRLVYRRSSIDVRARYQWRKTSAYVAVFVGAFVFFRIWVGAISSLATFFGLLSAGIAIALKDPLANIAGWLFIVWKRPFVPGDRITIRAHTGDVIDQSVFVFTLLEVGTEFAASQSTGRIIHLPNGWLFTDSVINFTRGFPYVWNEIPVLVSFESNWRAAKRIMFDIANEHGNKLTEDAERKLRREAQEFLIFYSKLTPTVYTSVRDSGVELTMRYLVEPRRRRGSEQTIWEAILDGFALCDDIEFAYPTRRIFQNAIEGKPGVLPKAQRRAAGLSAAPEPPPPPPPPIESDV